MTEAKRSRQIGGEDRISALADDLLIQILLLIPTKDAVSTTFLSKRWRFVWTKLPRLDYKDSELEESSDKSVWWLLDKSMRIHNAPILETLSIFLGQQCPVDVDVTKWVANAAGRFVRELKFELYWISEPIIMPNSLYTCKTLTKLILSGNILVDVPSPVSLPSLIELQLIEVAYKDDDSLIKLLSSCPILKNLVVLRGDVEDYVRNFIVKVPSLQRLEYHGILYPEDEDEDEEEDAHDDDDDDEDRSLVIDTPALTHLHISDPFGYFCSIEYMPRLREAYVDVAFNPDENFLRSLSSIKYLQLYPVDTMVPWCNVVYSQLLKCRIYRFQPEWCESLVVLLSNSPKLKEFQVNSIFEIDRSTDIHVPVLWDQPNSIPKCLLSHLKIFKWRGYAGREDEKEVVRYILENSKCLKMAVICLNSKCNLEEKRKMIEELKSMPRVSTSLLKLVGR